MVDLVTPGYKAASVLARLAPHRVAAVAAVGLGGLAVRLAPERRAQVERNLRRIDPSLDGVELDRRVRQTFESYARYYEESFRLPGTSPADLDAGFTHEGYEHLHAALEGGNGAIMAMPHLGGWEWSGFWLTQVQGIPVTAVVEQLEPPALFDWFEAAAAVVRVRDRARSDRMPAPPPSGRSRPTTRWLCSATATSPARAPRSSSSGSAPRFPAGRPPSPCAPGRRSSRPPSTSTAPTRAARVVLPAARHDPARQAARRRPAGHPGPRPRPRGPHPPGPGAVAPPPAQLAVGPAP